MRVYHQNQPKIYLQVFSFYFFKTFIANRIILSVAVYITSGGFLNRGYFFNFEANMAGTSASI